MRVGIIPPRLLDRPTGIVSYTRALAGALARPDTGVDVVLLLRPGGGDPPEWLSAFETDDVGAGEGGRVRGPLLSWWLSRAARRLDLDILHATGNIAPFAPLRLGVRRIVTVHDVGPLVCPGQRSPRERLTHAALIPPLRYLADAVITDSVSSAKDMVRSAALPPEMIHVVPLGTDPPPGGAAPWGPPDRTLFLAVGDVALHKNLARVIDAFRAVHIALPESRLVVAGRMRFGGEVVRASASDLCDSVTFLGYVPRDDLESLYRTATALVFPSLHEGFGLPVLEAMARGVPVVTSDRSSLPEVAGAAALLVDPTSVTSISEAMLRVARNDRLARDLSRLGVERAKQFTWDRTAAGTARAYAEALAHRPAATPTWAGCGRRKRSFSRTWLRAGVAALRAGPSLPVLPD